MKRRTFHRGVAIAACLFVAAAPCAAARAEQPSSPDASLAQWIAQLDSPRYKVREQATQQLLGAGPAALDVLTATANGERPEPADRAAWILRQLAETDDLALRRRVLEHLLQLKNRPQIVAEAHAALAAIQHELAVQAIEQLGGRYQPEGIDEYWEQRMPNRVILSDDWQGGDEGLEHLAQLNDVRLVMVIGSDISPEGFAKLQSVKSLEFLHLYGTRLNEDDVAELRKLLPNVRNIDYRRGALLGIQGWDNPPVRIRKVQPGTAAAAAGMREGDIIRKYNGRPVTSFKELTERIGRQNPGDEVSVELTRAGKTMELQVKLGRWKAP